MCCPRPATVLDAWAGLCKQAVSVAATADLSDELRDNHGGRLHTATDAHGRQGQFSGHIEHGGRALTLPDKEFA
jgi:hypothetical protein